MRKFILSVLALFLILIVGVLFTPLSLVQDRLLSEVNKIEDLHIDMKGEISYRLIRPDRLELGALTLKYKNYVIELNHLVLNLELKPILKGLLAIDELQIDAQSVEVLDKEGARVPSSIKEQLNITIEKINIKKLLLKVGEYRGQGQIFKDLTLEGEGTKFNLKSFRLEATPKLSIGKEMIAISGSVKGPVKEGLEFDLHTTKADIPATLEYFNFKNFNITGEALVNVKGSLKFSDPMNTLDGSLTVDATDLKWVGKDIDAILGSYIDSRSLGLLDAAGFLSMGPVGLLVSKGLNVSKTGLQGVISGESTIRRLYVETKIDSGELVLRDVAMSTQEFRVAAKGSFEIVPDYRFKDFVVATVDERGCSLFEQEIGGTLNKPSIGVLSSAAGEALASVGNLLKKARKLLAGCEPFYTGTVEAPQK